MEYSFKAVLFDFDGVVVDTESQYTIFWDEINEKYLPEVENLALKLKGNTLVEVFEKYFPNNETRAKIKKELNEFQSTMTYPYIPGVAEFVKKLRNAGVKTAVATSSDRDKMSFVYKACPEIRNMFDSILTAEERIETLSRLLYNRCKTFRFLFKRMHSGRGFRKWSDVCGSFRVYGNRTDHIQSRRSSKKVQRCGNS